MITRGSRLLVILAASILLMVFVCSFFQPITTEKETSQVYYLAMYGKVSSVENYHWLFDNTDGLIVNIFLNKEIAGLSGLPEKADMNIWVNRHESSEWEILRIDSFLVHADGTLTEDYFASISQGEKNLDRRIALVRNLQSDGNYLFKIFLHKKEATLEEVGSLREDIDLGCFQVNFLSKGNMHVSK